MLRKFFKISCVAVFIMLFPIGTFAADQIFSLKMHHQGPLDHPYHKGALEFKERVAKYSDNTILIDIFPNNELASGRQAVEAVQFGTIDIALESSMSITNFEKAFGVLDMPFLFPNRNVAFKVLDGAIGATLAKKLEEKNLKLLYYWDNGFRNISNSKGPIHSATDLKGLKIRVPESKVYISTFEALGAIPTPMAFNELFAALQLKTVDGQENPNGHMIAYKLYEVQTHFAISNHIYTTEPLLIRKDLFDSFSQTQKDAILKAAAEAGEMQRKLSADLESSFLEQIKEQGVAVTTPNLESFRDAVKPVYDNYKGDFGELIEQILATK
ncbi:MAG: TRAP transporter substrate-binding protein [Synergistaceae bacterium]|jgi:tripartite ATP-independent transporter DctP family solute receptor|nr:TRAP transporter substrate-binding protein [Synergistaceae bacterium]